MSNEIRYLAQPLSRAGVPPLNDRDRRVLERVARRIEVTRDLNRTVGAPPRRGQRPSEKAARVASGALIIGFALFLAAWVGLNVLVVAGSTVGPSPFVVLNLLFSMLAALQAAVILVSRSHQGARDRLVAARDPEVNIRSERAISELHEKVDHLTAQIEHLARLNRSSGDPPPAASAGGRPTLRVV